MMVDKNGRWVINGRGRCVGFQSHIPKDLGGFINYYIFNLKYKTIWERGGERTTRLATRDDIIRDVHEYP